MSNEQKITASRIVQLVVPVASVIVALASLFIGLSARRKELTCVFLGTERLVSVSNNFATDLSVQYRGQPVTSLTKMNYVLRNAGAVAIRGTDIVEPLELDYPVGTKLLDARVDKTLPSDFSFTTALKGSNAISLTFPLLNQGDEVYFSVYVYNSEPESPTLRGRVVDVRLLLASDAKSSQGRVLPFVSNTATKTAIFWILLLINALFGAATLGLWVYALKETIVAGNWRHQWKEAYTAAIEGLKEVDKVQYDYLRQRINAAGKNSLYFNDNAKKLLKEKGIPVPPTSGFDSITDGLGGTILLWGFTAFFTFTCLYIYTAPR